MKCSEAMEYYGKCGLADALKACPDYDETTGECLMHKRELKRLIKRFGCIKTLIVSSSQKGGKMMEEKFTKNAEELEKRWMKLYLNLCILKSHNPKAQKLLEEFQMKLYKFHEDAVKFFDALFERVN